MSKSTFPKKKQNHSRHIKVPINATLVPMFIGVLNVGIRKSSII